MGAKAHFVLIHQGRIGINQEIFRRHHLDPQAAMYLMVDIRPTGLTGLDFAERLLDEHKIAVMPGESFGASASGHIRIALTVPDDVLSPALNTLADFARSLL